MDTFPLKEEDDSVLYAGVIFRNISHLKLIENELKQSLEKERELSELKSRFLTMASHEFRTPLSNVLLSAQLLKRYTAVDAQPNRDKHIGRIVSSVNLITDILSDFLSVEKIERGVVKFNPEPLDIKEHITSIIQEIKETHKKRQDIFYRHTGGGIRCSGSTFVERNYSKPFIQCHKILYWKFTHRSKNRMG